MIKFFISSVGLTKTVTIASIGLSENQVQLITESSLLFVICLSAMKPLSVCQSSRNTTKKISSLTSNILTWLTEVGMVNDPRLTGYQFSLIVATHEH